MTAPRAYRGELLSTHLFCSFYALLGAEMTTMLVMATKTAAPAEPAASPAPEAGTVTSLLPP